MLFVFFLHIIIPPFHLFLIIITASTVKIRNITTDNPAPYPAFIISNDCLYIYRLATSVDFAGPPPVITMIRSRHWNDAITDVISTKTLVGFNSGKRYLPESLPGICSIQFCCFIIACKVISFIADRKRIIL